MIDCVSFVGRIQFSFVPDFVLHSMAQRQANAFRDHRVLPQTSRVSVFLRIEGGGECAQKWLLLWGSAAHQELSNTFVEKKLASSLRRETGGTEDGSPTERCRGHLLVRCRIFEWAITAVLRSRTRCSPIECRSQSKSIEVSRSFKSSDHAEHSSAEACPEIQANTSSSGHPS